jgi:dihydrofolate reductase
MNMKVVLVFVSTLNGKITRGDNPEVRIWSSKNDQDYYRGIWATAKLIVMGSSTYDLNMITPALGRLVVVMTRRPEDYKDKEVSGQMEFTSKSPQELVLFYRDSGFDLMTVVGGPKVATSFLNQSLVDELWLTIEPRLFGKGLNLVADDNIDVQLKMLSCERVNDNGTLITKYSIVRDQPIS